MRVSRCVGSMAFVVICSFFVSVLADDDVKTSYLSKRAEEQYKEVEYRDLKLQPKKYRSKKVKMKFPFNGESTWIRDPYRQKMPIRRYYYFALTYDEENERNKIHIMFSRRNRKKLLKKLLATEKGQMVLLYGKLKKISANKKKYYFDSGVNKRYFYIEDIVTDVMDESGENVANFNVADYEPVKAKALDLLASNYVDKKVRFSMPYAGREEYVEYPLEKIYDNDKYFKLETGYLRNSGRRHPLNGFTLIGSKTNQKLIDAIISLDDEASVDVYGTIKRYAWPNQINPKSKYYLLIDLIKKQGKDKMPGVPAAPQSTGKKRKPKRF